MNGRRIRIRISAASSTVLLPLMQQMGKTVFAISHDDHYFQHADRLLEMRAGQLAELTGEEREQASRDAVARTA